MKIILTQDVKALGKKGDVVQVAEGYGRNFLLPKGLGKEASPANLNSLAHENARADAKKKKELEEAKALAKKLQDAEVHITAKAGEGGRLFGSVTSKEISEMIQQQFHVEIDRRKMELKDAIKSIGAYDAVIRLHPEVQVKIKINVTNQ